MTSPRPLSPLLGLLLACAPDTHEEPPPDPIGPALYEHHSGWGAPSTTLFHDASTDTVQLLSSDDELEVIATLLPETVESLEDEFDAIAAGANIGEFDPQCLGFIDDDQAVLHVPLDYDRLTFAYPWLCPPSGLTAIDEILMDVETAMRDCSPSVHFTNCEIIE